MEKTPTNPKPCSKTNKEARLNNDRSLLWIKKRVYVN